MLHRDIKPASILLTEYGEPQLTDFGIARITGGEETTRVLVAGSPAYTAPELLSGTNGTRLTSALLGDLLYDQGHLTEADHLLDRSHTLGAEGGTVDFMLATYGTGARLKRLLGQRDAAKERLDEGARPAHQLRLPRLAARIANERIRAGTGWAANHPDTVEGGLNLHDRDNGLATVTAEVNEDSAIRGILYPRTDLQGVGPASQRAHALVESIDRRARPRAFLTAALLRVEALAVEGDEAPPARNCFR